MNLLRLFTDFFNKKFEDVFKRKKNESGLKIITKNRVLVYKNFLFYNYGGEKIDNVLSILDFSECVIDSVGISFGLNSSDLGQAIELKAYEELSLDPSLDYVIKYMPQNLSQAENDHKYFVFVAKTQALQAKFGRGPVDFIAYAPLIISALFKRNFLPSVNDFAFVYIDDTDAFVAVYSAGTFQYCKGSQKLSLAYLSNKFCEIAGELINKDEFNKFFLEGSLELARPDIEDTLTKFWTQFFTTLSEILLHAKRAYKINEYTATYVGASIGSPSKIEKIATSYFSTKVLPFDFNLGAKTDADILTRLLPLYYESDGAIDFSIFHRPPPFLQRDSGIFISIIGFALCLALLYPLTAFFPYEAYLTYKIASMKSDFELNGIKKSEYTAQILNIESALKQDENKLEALKKSYAKSIETIKDLASVKTNYTPRAITIIDISKAVVDSKARLLKLDINETNATLFCIATDSSALSLLINSLTKLYKSPPSTPKMLNENGAYKAEIILQNVGVVP